MILKKSRGPRVNQEIRESEIQLIDHKGENRGVVKTDEAIKLAKDNQLDLVEVGATATPPVCKIMDFSKYLYEQKKKSRKGKNKTKEQKEFRFSPVIDKGDIEHRVRRAKEYLDKGHPVKLVMQKKGRQPMDLAKEVFAEILTNFSDYSSIEAEPKREGNRISITLKANG
ncbi:MAG TPA: translation initiation factor IF-3 [Candidatus Dojkabacteria bacterium]|nr:translation initiation factor IF-3 [Candidatus Dojkabacteria bacterium]